MHNQIKTIINKLGFLIQNLTSFVKILEEWKYYSIKIIYR